MGHTCQTTRRQRRATRRCLINTVGHGYAASNYPPSTSLITPTILLSTPVRLFPSSTPSLILPATLLDSQIAGPSATVTLLWLWVPRPSLGRLTWLLSSPGPPSFAKGYKPLKSSTPISVAQKKLSYSFQTTNLLSLKFSNLIFST